MNASPQIGGIYGLCIDGLRMYWEPLPFVLIGGQAMLASILVLNFPETTGCKLPETTDEALNKVGKDYELKPWFKPTSK